jgi:DNA processing protein
MPVFLSSRAEQNALCYFTILTLKKYSVKATIPIFNEVRNDLSWEIALREYNFNTAEIEQAKRTVLKGFGLLDDFTLIVEKGETLYPKRLDGVIDAPQFLFLKGEPLLANQPVISVVGSRNASEEGISKARRLARLLSERNITVASGLAKGIDRAAHQGTYDVKKPTIAVIGTPLNKVYPAEHAMLQQYISQTGLVISQFIPNSPVQRWNFPMRNATMSGISIATIVVEAGETSGALIQAREALKQGREVFIPQSALDNPNLIWPRRFVNELGAKKFTTIDDLMDQLYDSKLVTTLSLEQTQSTSYSMRVDHVTGM